MNNWKTFFDHYAPKYMQEDFTKNTLAEVDFILKEFKLPTGSSILDMGCGTGRHSVELSRRGWRMTGVDQSEGMLAEAAKAAAAAGVSVELIQCNACDYQATKQFDAAICLCEGAFGLVNVGDDPEAHDPAIMRNVAAALKPGAPFLLTALNGLRGIRQHSQADVDSGKFDPIHLIETYNMEYDTPQGNQSVKVCEKTWLPHELIRMAKTAGFEVLQVWGGTAGNWNRKVLELDEMEIMLLLRRQA
jgi:2-polyprenyl-3-methyl-5-hydroxy-6-metoxy-1,4-benzoquinol methylase